MMKLCKDYLLLDVFTTLAYALSIVQFLGSVVVVGFLFNLETKEVYEFVCYNVPPKYRKFFHSVCYRGYRKHDSPVYAFSLSTFVILSVMFQIIVVVIYSQWTRQNQAVTEPEDDAENTTQNKGNSLSLHSYFVHLMIRFLCGILFIILQLTVFFPSGFKPEFNCTPPMYTNLSYFMNMSGIIPCNNSIAPKKELCSIIVSALNTCLPFIMLMEIIHLCRRLPRFKHAVDSLLLFIKINRYCFLFYLLIGSILCLLVFGLKTLIT